VRRAPIPRRPLRPGTKPLRRTAKPLARRTPLERRALGRASLAQRAAVRGARCIVCGTDRAIDPAHLVPRSLGGCDHPLCVVALCRIHHRGYDRGRLDLVPYLEPRHRAQAAHAVGHLGLVGALWRLSGRRVANGEAA
jgi:hypothetical protein